MTTVILKLLSRKRKVYKWVIYIIAKSNITPDMCHYFKDDI